MWTSDIRLSLCTDNNDKSVNYPALTSATQLTREWGMSHSPLATILRSGIMTMDWNICKHLVVQFLWLCKSLISHQTFWLASEAWVYVKILKNNYITFRWASSKSWYCASYLIVMLYWNWDLRLTKFVSPVIFLQQQVKNIQTLIFTKFSI